MIYILRYLAIAVFTVFWGAIGTLSVLFDRSGDAIIWVARNWVGWVLWVCAIEVEAEGLENVDPDTPTVFMSNHESVFDVAAIITTIPVNWRFVAKRELTWIPFFGWCLSLGKHVIVHRGNRAQAVASLDRAARQIRSGTNVIIFPEGTRSTSGDLNDFKSGGFHLALGAGAPILPISVSGSRYISEKGSLKVRSGRVLVRYGLPISSHDVDRSRLKGLVREAIEKGKVPDHGRPDGRPLGRSEDQPERRPDDRPESA